MEGERKQRWASGRGIRLSPKKRLWVKGLLLHKRVTNFLRLIRSWWCRRRPAAALVSREEDGLYYKPLLRRSNSFYADAIADCIDFIKRSS